MLETLKLGDSTIYLYNMMSYVGILFAVLVFIGVAKAYKMKEWVKTICLFTLSMLVAYAFSFIFGDITYFTDWESYRATMFIPDSSLFIGGIPIGLGVFILLAKKFIEQKDIVRYTIPSLITLQAFSRVGCMFAGCCYGIPSNGVFSLVYPPSSQAALQFGAETSVLPLPAFETIFLTILLAAVFYMLKTKRPGILSVYFIAYGMYTFINSFFLAEDIFSPFGIRFQGWVGLAFILCGMISLPITLLSKPKK